MWESILVNRGNFEFLKIFFQAFRNSLKSINIKQKAQRTVSSCRKVEKRQKRPRSAPRNLSGKQKRSRKQFRAAPATPDASRNARHPRTWHAFSTRSNSNSRSSIGHFLILVSTRCNIRSAPAKTRSLLHLCHAVL